MKCIQENCQNEVYVKKSQLCKKHYARMWYRAYRPVVSVEDRFLKYVTKTPDCWIWTGARAGKKNGPWYGHFRLNGSHKGAHRFSYEHYVGEIPEGLQIDHLCFNTLCVNPKHLEAVTAKENCIRRSNKKVVL